MKSFENKVVVITGAGSGMGRSYALQFAKLGSKLALNDFDKEALVAVVEELAAGGFKEVYAHTFDVSNKEEMYDFAADVKTKLGNAHVVINNAGIEGSTKPAFLTDELEFKRVMDINYFGVVYGCKAFLPQLLENKEGVIVNVSSTFGIIGAPNNADYCASKFAVRGFTETLMVEFHNTPIQIHCLHPGGIATRIARKQGGQEFSKKYLITPADEIVTYVIKCIRSKKLKIIYGHGAFRAWLGAKFVPLKWLKAIIWHEMQGVAKKEDYEFLKK